VSSRGDQAKRTDVGVYAIVGSDRFLRHDSLVELLKTIGDAPDAFGPTQVEGDSVSLAQVLDEVRTPSLLGDRRIVIVQDADDFVSANREALEKYCASPAPTGTLVLLCDTMPRNTRLHKVIAGRGGVIMCEAPEGRALTTWIVRRAKLSYGKQLGEAAAQRLREHLGDSPGWIDSELAKLAAYVGSRPEITREDIVEVTGELREEKVFAVMDAIANGDASLALKLWEQVWATDRAAPGRAIAGLAWSVRKLLDAKQEFDRGVDAAALARKMFTDPSVLRRRLERTTQAGLREQQRDLLAADLAVKTGNSTVDVAIEKFIVKHAAARSAGRELATAR